MTTQVVGYMDNRHFPETQPRDVAPTEHRCSRCYGAYGKSAIRCVNEPVPTKWLIRHKPKRSKLAVLVSIRDTEYDAHRVADHLNYNTQTNDYYVEEWREGSRKESKS